MNVVIFGTQALARLYWYVLSHDSRFRVVGFTVHAAHMRESAFMGLPVVPFEQLAEVFPPQHHGMVAALGWTDMNGLRARVVAEGRAAGYDFVSWVSSRATVWPDLAIGKNTMVFDACIVQPFAHIGDNCIVRSGANISHDVFIGNDCFIAGSAALGGGVQVGAQCVLGMNCTIRDRIRIAPRSFVAAGAVVVADIAESGVYAGVPARRQAISVEQASYGRSS